MSAAGFFSGVAGNLDKQADAHQKDAIALRERQADDIQGAIHGIQANPNLSPQEKAFQIGEARKKLQGLYHPSEAPQLLDRLKKIFHVGGSGTQPGTPPIAPGKVPPVNGSGPMSEVIPGASVQVGATTIPGTPTTVQLRPGMTLDDVLAAGAPQAQKKAITPSPVKGEDGKYYIWYQTGNGFQKEEVPGYTEESELQQYVDAGLSPEDAQKAVRIKHGLEPKAGTDKPEKAPKMKMEGKVPTLDDPENGKTYTSKDQIPPDRKDLHKMWDDFETARAKEEGQESDKQAKRDAHQLDMMGQRLENALKLGDYRMARRDLNKYYTDNVQPSTDRLRTMESNVAAIAEGKKNGKVDQQAMLSLLANHIGMTMGAQRGARITRAVWDEARESAPWWDTKMAQFFHTDPETGDKIFDGWKTGVTLTDDQIDQMMKLSRDKVDVVTKGYKDMESHYQDELDSVKPPEGKAKGKGKTKGKTKGTQDDPHVI